MVPEMAEQLAPHATPGRRQQVQDGVPAVLPAPFDDQLPGGRDQVDEERRPGRPVATVTPGEPAGHTDQTRQQGLQDRPGYERVELAMAKERLDDRRCPGGVARRSARAQPGDEVGEVCCRYGGDGRFADREPVQDVDGGR